MTTGLKAHKRPTIGLLISNISDIYTRQIWPGVADTLRDRDMNLVIFSGNPVFSRSSMLYRHYGQQFSQQPVNSYDYQSNIIYELIDPNVIDGLILTTGSLSHSSAGDELTKFHSRLRSFPMVSIAIPIEGVPSVLVDNKKGIADTIDHLVKVHGYRRIAFIKGPENHPEAQERFQAYCESLERNGIAVDGSIICRGDFMWHSGLEAAKELLDNHKGRFDAVVAANDSMAISAMTYFQSAGLRIPGDIAVTGFDNIDLARYSLTPLSTVRQPFYQQARKAAEFAADLSMGKKVPGTTVLPSEFITRTSCGCLPESILVNDSGPLVLHSNAPVKDTDADDTEKLTSYFHRAAEGTIPKNVFLSAVNETAYRRLRSGKDIRELVVVLAEIKSSAVAASTGPERILACERLFQDALLLMVEKSQIFPGMKLIDYINSDTMLISAMHGIMSRIQIKELLDTIEKELPRLNIPGCAISIYEKSWQHQYNDDWNIPDEIELVMCYDRNGKTELPVENRKYRTAGLFPGNFLTGDKSRVLIAEALYFAEEQLGLILFEQGNAEGIVYELLRLQISNAIKGSLMLHQQQLIQKDLQGHIQIMDAELDLARKIQFRLIPEKSILDNVSFYYKPMAKVGGDFFDFIQFRNPDLIGFFISDVSGHGVPAALVTSMIKTTLLQTASSSKSPADVLRQLNRILISQSPANFITAFYGILNRKKRELEYSFAGHNPPLLITKKGTSPLPSAGKALPLAVLDNTSLKELRRDFLDQKIVLENGSKILLYTDGLTETVNIKEKMKHIGPELLDFESSELFRVIERYKDLPSGAFIEKITERLHKFRGIDEYEDDVCLICVDII